MITPLQKCKTCIVSVNFNGEQDTINLLKSINAQDNGIGVLIVDNTADGEKLKLVEEGYPDVSIVYNSENVGFAKANNKGVSFLKQFKNVENIFILNNDAYFQESDSVLKLEKVLNETDFDVVSPVIQDSKSNQIWFFRGKFSLLNAGAKSILKGESLKLIRNVDLTYPSEFITGCAMFMKASTYNQLGGFNEKYFMYVEDIDLCFRMKKAGFNVGATKEVVIQHKSHSSIIGASDKVIKPLDEDNKNRSFYVQNVLNNSFLFANENLSGFYLVLFKLILIVKWVRNARRFKSNDMRKEVFDILKRNLRDK